MKLVKISKYLKQRFETISKDNSEWFGYYNYDTLNDVCSKLLCNRIGCDGIAPQKGMTIDLGYYDLAQNSWIKIGKTDSWNWQQGAMMQWLPSLDKSEKIIFNTSQNGRLISKVINLDSETETIINWPIYGITPDGLKSITLELERSRWCRAYHYKSVDNVELEGRLIDSDGIFEIDLENNTRKRIIPINKIINIDSDPDFDKKKHWLEHIMISPNGKRFCFLHRFSDENNVFSYSTRLFIANIDGSNLQIIPGWRKFKWTHFGWKSDNEFSIYTYTPVRIAGENGFLNSFKTRPLNLKEICKGLYCAISSRLPYPINYVLNNGQSYYQLYSSDEDGIFKLKEKWQRSYFDIDGHPSFTLDGRYMITDSYPDKNGYQRLIIFDTETKKGIIIAKIFAYYKGNPASCDLHPKLSKDNRYVVVDTAYDSKHHMILFELNWTKIKAKISNE